MPYGVTRAVEVRNNYAYVGGFHGSLHVIDMSDQRNPCEIGSADAGYGENMDIEVYDNNVYMINYGDYAISIVDISEPKNPQLVDFYYTESHPFAIAQRGNYLFVGVARNPMFQVLDLSNPTEPIVIGRASLTGEYPPTAIDIESNWAYISLATLGFSIVDISEITEPYEQSNIELENGYYTAEVTVRNEYAYVSAGTGLSIINVADSMNPLEKGFFPTGSGALRLRVDGDYVYLAESSAGLWIIDVSRPEDPQSAGHFAVESGVIDVEVQEGFSYVPESPATVNDTGRVWILDVSDPAHPVQVSQIQGILPWSNTPLSIDVSNGYLYLTVPADSGLLIADVSNPESPVISSFYKTGGRPYDVFVSGRYAYLANGIDGLRIIDASEPTAPEEIGFWANNLVAVDVVVKDSLAIVAASQYLFSLDVSDPANPVELDSILPRQGGGDWKLSVSNDYVYVVGAYNNTDVYIIDISDPSNLKKVGLATERGTGKNGVDSKGIFFYFSDSSRGLFIYRNDLFSRTRNR